MDFIVSAPYPVLKTVQGAAGTSRLRLRDDRRPTIDIQRPADTAYLNSSP